MRHEASFRRSEKKFVAAAVNRATGDPEPKHIGSAVPGAFDAHSGSRVVMPLSVLAETGIGDRKVEHDVIAKNRVDIKVKHDVVELVDRTQKWMFDKRIRNRLAADLTSSVMRKQNSDRNVSRTLVMSTRPQGNKSSSGAADGRVVAVSVTEDKTVKQTNNQGAQMGPPTSRPDGAATHPAATFDKARRIVGSAANNTATWTRRRMQPTAMSASALDPSKLARPELARPELARPELARPELDRPELARPELAPPKSDPARDVPRTLANNRSLVALLETRLSNTMTTKVHKWPFARRCATASVTIKLADAVVPAVVEWMQSCANGRLCVVKRYKVNVHELQTHRMQTVRIRLTDDAFIRLSMRCDGSVVRHQWMKLADLRALVGSAADQAAFLQLNR
ncbi:unnamed protein product [Agarophyton chilense]